MTGSPIKAFENAFRLRPVGKSGKRLQFSTPVGASSRPRAPLLLVSGALLTILGVSPAAAEDNSPVPPEAPPTTLGGDWFGVRPALLDRGVKFTVNFTGEGADSVDGGRQRGQAFAYEFNFATDVDLDKIAGWSGAKFHVSFIHRDGENLSRKIGNIFAVQEIYSSPDKFRLFLLSIEQSFLDGRIDLVGGRVVESYAFANSKYFCTFQTLAVCGVPFSLALNGSLTYYPVSSWGGRGRVKFGKGWQLQAGAYEINPQLAKRDGFNLSTNGATGVSLPIELVHTSERSIVKIGYVYDTSDRPDLRDPANTPFMLVDPATRHDRGRSSGWVMLEYILGSTKPDARNVVLLVGTSVADLHTSYLQDFEYAGVVVNGLFAARPKDRAVMLFARGGVSRDLARSERLRQATDQTVVVQDAETVMEVHYQAYMGRGITLTPNVQQVFRPGASGEFGNATVLGLKINVAL